MPPQRVAGPRSSAGPPRPLASSRDSRSTGPAADLIYGWTRDLHGRLSVSYQPQLDRDENNDQIRATGSLLLDWHPGGGGFRLSGGLAYLRTEFYQAFSSSFRF